MWLWCGVVWSLVIMMNTGSGDEKVLLEEAGEATTKRQNQMSMQSRDQARIGQLKGSITRIEEQIESTKRELNAVCESLKNDTNLTTASAPTLPVASNAEEDRNPSLQISPSVDISNEQILKKARAMVNGHIQSLTKYNQLKDVAMGLFELIAEHKGVRIGEVLREDGVDLDD